MVMVVTEGHHLSVSEEQAEAWGGAWTGCAVGRMRQKTHDRLLLSLPLSSWVSVSQPGMCGLHEWLRLCEAPGSAPRGWPSNPCTEGRGVLVGGTSASGWG